MSRGDVTLLEREDELSLFSQALERVAAGAGELLIVEGEAGIGKTSLLRELARLSHARDFWNFRARGGELERDFPHGVVRQLYESNLLSRSVEEQEITLAGAARLALPALGLAPPTPGLGASDAAFAANHGLYWFTANVAEVKPIVIVVDDAHWADVPSLQFLNYLGRRLDDLPVLVAVGIRTGEPGSPWELLDALRRLPITAVIRPRSLSRSATGSLVQRATSASDPTLHDACHEATGGNPFLISELVQALRSEDGDTVSAERVRRLGPTSVSRTVLSRLAPLGPAAVELARAVAVLDTASVADAAALANLDIETAEAEVDELVGANILTAGERLRFVHPMVRAAVYGDLPERRRIRMHSCAARVLGESGADPDRTAVHLLLTEPGNDPKVVDALRAAAARALLRGAPGEASTLLRRALREPPPGDRARLLFELGNAAFAANQSDAVDFFGQVLALSRDPELRIEAVERLAHCMFISGRWERAVELVEQAADEIPAENMEDRYRLEACLLVVGSNSDLARRRILRRISPLVRDVAGETRWQRNILAAAIWANVFAMTATASEIADLAARCDPMLVISENPPETYYWIGWGIAACAYADDLDAALRVSEAAGDQAQERGSIQGVALNRHAMRVRYGHMRGDILHVEADARLAAELLPASPHVASFEAIVYLVQGRVVEAQEALERNGFFDGEVDGAVGRALLVLRAQIHAQLGRPERALGDARQATRRAVDHDTSYTILGFDWSTAWALAVSGATDEARDEGIREHAVLQRTQAKGCLGIGHLIRGLTALPNPDLADLEKAVSYLDGTGRNLDLSRALIEYGAALRRTNRRLEARGFLSRGMDLAHRCGAVPLVNQARDELFATGARPRHLVVTGVDALTASEERVARMAREGKSNTDIAQALFVSRKTVETHLGRAYQKLGITGRGELATALASH